MNGKQVLIVEDEEKIAALLSDYLNAAGFDCHRIDRGDDAIAWLRLNRPDMILLDLMLPGSDGLAVCREARKEANTPIIMITARVDEIDRLLGLELGADDYICKPFSVREVVARVKAIFRRLDMTLSDKASESSSIAIDEHCFEARIGDQELALTPVEFRILKLLTSHPGRVYSRDQLIDSMYRDGRVVSDRTVDSHVKNLRKKLVSASPDNDWIRSIYGVGYRLD